MFHGFLDWNYEADSFEGEDCGADEEGPRVGIEWEDIGDSVGGEGKDSVVVEVDEAEHDKEVCDERGDAEFGHVADH